MLKFTDNLLKQVKVQTSQRTLHSVRFSALVCVYAGPVLGNSLKARLHPVQPEVLPQKPAGCSCVWRYRSEEIVFNLWTDL